MNDIMLKTIINRQAMVPYNTFSPLRLIILNKIKKITISIPKIIINKFIFIISLLIYI